VQRLRLHRRELALLGALAGLAVAVGVLLLAREGDAAGVSFSGEIQTIFDAKCAVCHPTSYDYLDLRRGRSYDDLVRVSSALQPAFERVLPGRPELSYLLTHVPDPSRENLLTDDEKRLITTWVEEGASDN
jgi:hypothetical protein